MLLVMSLLVYIRSQVMMCISILFSIEVDTDSRSPVLGLCSVRKALKLMSFSSFLLFQNEPS